MTVKKKVGTCPLRPPLNTSLHSNHPPNILEQLLKFIEKRVFETSSNIDVFNESIKIYNDALHESNFKETLQFVIQAPKNNDENKKRKRKRNIICFNPPYTKMLKPVLEKHSYSYYQNASLNTIKCIKYLINTL